MSRYFLVTYAIMALVKGNKNYSKFVGQEMITSLFNLYGLYYSLLRDYDKDVAEKNFFQFKEYLIEIEDQNFFEASKFKLSNQKIR